MLSIVFRLSVLAIIILSSAPFNYPIAGHSQDTKLQREFIEDDGFTQVSTITNQGVKTIYLSGQVGQGKNLREHVESAFQGVVTRLESVGATVDDVVKIRIYVKNFKPEDYAIVRDTRLQVFNEAHWPASTLLGVQSLYLEPMTVEIEAIAIIPDSLAPNDSLKREYAEPSNGFHQTVSVKSNGLKTIYVSGQVAQGDDLAEQVESIYKNLAQRLEAAGANLTDIVKLNTYITDFNPQRDLTALRQSRSKVFDTANLPASALIGVQSLAADNFKIEIDAIAVVAEKGYQPSKKQFIEPSQGFTQVVTSKENRAKTIYLSGQVGRPGDELEMQVDQVFANLRKRLEAAGASPNDLLKIIIYMANYTPGAADGLGTAMTRYGFPQDKSSAVTLIGVPSLFSETALIEVEGIAVAEE